MKENLVQDNFTCEFYTNFKKIIIFIIYKIQKERKHLNSFYGINVTRLQHSRIQNYR